SPRVRVASMATLRLSLTFFCPMNSRRSRGRSLSSYEASSSPRAAETRRSLLSAFSSEAGTWAIVKRNHEKGQSCCFLHIPYLGGLTPSSTMTSWPSILSPSYFTSITRARRERDLARVVASSASGKTPIISHFFSPTCTQSSNCDHLAIASARFHPDSN